ncbi:glycosyltransferase [Aggregatimonas sangjinii]|uniref:Glycosyltransferase n=1 Tax=Aggregatimonas sangjinii TaxID=2583587 RepID=A0A5B7SWE9_9FLAO|nr:glycosyltransferase [Aggregatimonas sangjinii]QCX01659.1 glycosyltransferase [Aggregatimonas sangjinii]
MKILLLIESLTSGGRERRLVELVKGFSDFEDVELAVVVFSDKIHYTEIFDFGIPVKILKRVPKKNPVVFYRLFEFCRNWKPDLMHSWGTMSTIWAIPSSVLLRVKLINANIVNAPINMGFFNKQYFRARLTFPFSEVILGNSWAGLKAYKVPKEKAVCIYNGFGVERLSNLKDAVAIRKRFHIKTPYVIGMVASFTDKKDFETLINAALILFETRNDITFLAIGEGPNLEKCKKLIPPEYTPLFIFTGVQNDIESIVNIFDIGVLATNTKVHGEGISNAILEYMALGKPTVATTGGGTNEIVEDMKTGFLIPPDSPRALADKVNYLLESKNEADQMGVKAKNRITSVFGLEKMTTEYHNLYKRLLA